jgi:hypothetical protein
MGRWMGAMGEALQHLGCKEREEETVKDLKRWGGGRP